MHVLRPVALALAIPLFFFTTGHTVGLTVHAELPVGAVIVRSVGTVLITFVKGEVFLVCPLLGEDATAKLAFQADLGFLVDFEMVIQMILKPSKTFISILQIRLF